MKKIFTILAAALVSMTMNAEALGSWRYAGGDAPAAGTSDAGTNLTVEFITSNNGKSFAKESAAYNAAVPDNMKSQGSNGLKLGANALYLKVTTEGGFIAGDSVVICGYNAWKISSTDAHSGDIAASVATGTGKKDYNLGTFVLTEDADALYMMRAESTGTCIAAISIERTGTPSTDPVLKASTESLSFEATAANPNPSATVTFTGKNLTPGAYNLTTPGAGSWTVNPTQVTVGEDGKLNATITVGYTLNEYVESETSSISLTINNITKTVALSATSEASINYINASVNIEGLVVENGKSYNIKGAFAAANIEYSNVDALDSLNNSKTARNEPYLGLKIKKADGYVAGWLQAGHTIRVKFGFVDSNYVKVFIGDQMAKFGKGQLATPLEFTAIEDTYVKIQTTSGNTVVIKQIMLDDPVADVMYKITYAASEHGATTGWKVAFPNEEVFLTFAPEEGYIVMHCDYNGTEIIGQPNVQESFIMPAAPVIVTTVYDLPNAIDNTDAAVKSVKFFQNGQLFIEKNGVIYNAQGTIVK